jgi:predicted ABC-type ATPase
MPTTLRMRVFAGPNGSGKSTMYEQVRTTVINGRPVDLGHYVNPDVIARELKTTGSLNLRERYGLNRGERSLVSFAKRSGLMRENFDALTIRRGHRFRGHEFILRNKELAEHFAQLLAAFIIDLLLRLKRKFSFETVFSHSSKVELMRQAKARGFKVYLYFIATNSAEINKDRVRTRVMQKGHDVPPDLIEKRYDLSLAQILPALEHCYHAFFFDNSGTEAVMFAEMKETALGKQWAWNTKAIPDWFIRSYLLPSGNPLFADVARIALAERK